jgi:hypothetical protein
MTRKECLEQAMGCVLRDRNNSYGGPEDSFGVIANFWSVYLGRKVYPHDVAMMMSLLKIARIKANKSYADGYVDLAGYAACGAECACEKPEAESGCCQSGNDQQEFKYGERVQFRDEIPSTSEPHWFEGVYVERLSDGGHAVKFGPHGHVIHCSDKEIRPVQTPKAEGCEDLVYDAPQTPEEVCRHIVDCNPATFKPRTPTGEELAEMAEEEGNA